MREALSSSFWNMYGSKPDSNIGVCEFDRVQIERYKVHGIAKVVLHYDPYAAKLNFGNSKKWWGDVIIDIEPLNSVMPSMQPKGAWFGRNTQSLEDVCDLELLISGKQQLPKKAFMFDLCRDVEGVLILPHYSTNRVDFDLGALYGELCE